MVLRFFIMLFLILIKGKDGDVVMKFHRTLPIQWRRYNWYNRRNKFYGFGAYNLFKGYRRRIKHLSPKPSRYILWND